VSRKQLPTTHWGPNSPNFAPREKEKNFAGAKFRSLKTEPELEAA
jgi:hypothetical protein